MFQDRVSSEKGSEPQLVPTPTFKDPAPVSGMKGETRSQWRREFQGEKTLNQAKLLYPAEQACQILTVFVLMGHHLGVLVRASRRGGGWKPDGSGPSDE